MVLSAKMVSPPAPDLTRGTSGPRLCTTVGRSWSSNLEGEQCFAPVPQHVTLTNKHINHPAMAVLAARVCRGGCRRVRGGRRSCIDRGAGLFLRSLGGNPMDVHLVASVNLRRYLLRLDGISLKNKLMLLMT
jgi:hypothetical protein